MFIWIIARDSLNQLALRRLLAIDNGLRAVKITDVIPNVQPQVGFAFGRIWPVAMKTIVGENRPHVASEIYGRWRFGSLGARANYRSR
jgi:hypothetical protein